MRIFLALFFGVFLALLSWSWSFKATSFWYPYSIIIWIYKSPWKEDKGVWQFGQGSISKVGNSRIFQSLARNVMEKILTWGCSRKTMGNSVDCASGRSQFSNGKEIKGYTNAPTSANHAASRRIFARCAHWILNLGFRWRLEIRDAEKMGNICWMRISQAMTTRRSSLLLPLVPHHLSKKTLLTRNLFLSLKKIARRRTGLKKENKNRLKIKISKWFRRK